MTGNAPLLVVVFGLPGTGKTTLAKSLSQAMPAQHLNTDMLRTELGRRDRYTDQDKALIYKRLFERVEDHLKKGESVVVDGTFSRESYRDPIREIVHRTGTNLKWIQAMAAEDIVQRRVSVERPFTQADFEVYLKVREEFQPPNEGALEVWTDRQDSEACLEQMLEFLKA